MSSNFRDILVRFGREDYDNLKKAYISALKDVDYMPRSEFIRQLIREALIYRLEIKDKDIKDKDIK